MTPAKRIDAAAHLDSLSIAQVARRWQCPLGDVEDLIRAGKLRLNVFLTGADAVVQWGDEPDEEGILKGEYVLTDSSAAALLDNNARTPHLWVEIQVVTPDGTRKAYLDERNKPVLARVSVETLPPDEGWRDRALRVSVAEVFRFEGEAGERGEQTAVSGTGRLLRDSQRHRERSLAVAAVLWMHQPDRTIADVLRSDEINVIALERAMYEESTLRKWIKDLCPNPRPGRPQKTRKQSRK